MQTETPPAPKIKGEEPIKVYIDNSDSSIRYIYKSKSTKKKDKKPLVIVVGCTCPLPTDNFPYQPPVFEYLKKIAQYIKKYSIQYGVPPIAVAGGIADEYNTRFMPNYNFIKKSVDKYQDETFPSSPEGLDNYNNRLIESEYQSLRKKDPNNIHRSLSDRVLYDAAGDYGKGNISLRTAIDLHDKYSPGDCTQMTRMGLVRYLVTDEGTAQYAALDIREGLQLMAGDLAPLAPRKKEAVLVSYYKAGLTFYNHFLTIKASVPSHKIQAGEGCRVCYQRKAIAEAIGVHVDAYDVVK